MAQGVLRELPDARFLIVGDGPRREALEHLSVELKIADAVQFLGSRSDIPDLLAACDLFALTSLNEANPVSILESLACEVPVVAPAVGSLHETVIDGETGYLVEPGNDRAMVDRWVELLGQPARARCLGQAGRQRVTQEWSLDHMVQGYERLIASVYASKSSHADPSNRECDDELDAAVASLLSAEPTEQPQAGTM